MEDERTGDLDGVHPLPVPVQAELEEVGQDEVGEGVAVARQLLGGFDPVKILLGWTLRFDIADDVLSSVPDAEVGISGLSLLREGGDMDPGLPRGFGKSPEEAFQARIVALLTGIALLGYVKDTLQILS